MSNTGTAAQQSASRMNGKHGGRPRAFTTQEQRIRERAIKMGRNALADCVKWWCDLVQGKIEGAELDHRMRAAENLADRFGLPRKTQHDVQGEDIAPKAFIFVEKFESGNGNGSA